MAKGVEKMADERGANLEKANLSGADLSGANLAKANLSGADIRQAFLDCQFLNESDLSGAIYDDGTNWPACSKPEWYIKRQEVG